MTHVTQTWWVKGKLGSRKKYCSRCNEQTDFVSSQKFRCNTNGKLIDVWLIYNCSRCKKSWNMPIEERQRVTAISVERLQQYYGNDADLADEISAGDLLTEYTVAKKIHCESLPTLIRVELSGNIKVRADRFFAKELGLSRAVFERSVKHGLVCHRDTGQHIWKRSLPDGLIVEIAGDLYFRARSS